MWLVRRLLRYVQWTCKKRWRGFARSHTWGDHQFAIRASREVPPLRSRFFHLPTRHGGCTDVGGGAVSVCVGEGWRENDPSKGRGWWFRRWMKKIEWNRCYFVTERRRWLPLQAAAILSLLYGVGVKSNSTLEKDEERMILRREGVDGFVVEWRMRKLQPFSLCYREAVFVGEQWRMILHGKGLMARRWMKKIWVQPLFILLLCYRRRWLPMLIDLLYGVGVKSNSIVSRWSVTGWNQVWCRSWCWDFGFAGQYSCWAGSIRVWGGEDF